VQNDKTRMSVRSQPGLRRYFALMLHSLRIARWGGVFAAYLRCAGAMKTRRGRQMQRREFIAGLAGAAAAPLAARAQQTKVPVVGLLNGVSFGGPYAAPVAAIRQGLQETGFMEEQNLVIEYRTADGHYERLPELATDLARSQVAVIVAIGASTRAWIAKAAVSAIPIVFAVGSDALELALVKNFDRSDATATGAAIAAGLATKRLELLLELRPGAPLVGYLDNSRSSETFEANVGDVTSAAHTRGRGIVVFDAGTGREVETAFTQMALQRVRALIVSPDPFLTTRHEQIIALAAQSRLPTIYTDRAAAVLGGLVSYGAVADDIYRLAGIFAGRILVGGAPAESPLMPPTRYELIINNRTARDLRITVPRRFLIRADEIID